MINSQCFVNTRLKVYYAAAEVSFYVMDFNKMSHFTTIVAQKDTIDLDLYPSYLLEVKALNYE